MKQLFYKILCTSLFIGYSFFIGAQSISKIGIEQLPSKITEELSKKYKKFTINNLAKKESEGNEFSYELELQKKNRLIYLTYDSNGNLLSKRKSKSFTYEGTEPVRKTQPAHDGHNHRH